MSVKWCDDTAVHGPHDWWTDREQVWCCPGVEHDDTAWPDGAPELPEWARPVVTPPARATDVERGTCICPDCPLGDHDA